MNFTRTIRGAMPARSRCIVLCMAASLLMPCIARPLAAQSCAGDCKAQGRVDIADLIFAVNIVLGLAPLAQCAALGSAPVGISHLVTAVNNALCSCQLCPTPLPTSTVTATMETATPTATPTPEAIISTGVEDNLQIASSDCPRALIDQLRQELVGLSLLYTLEQRGNTVRIDDGMGNFVEGTIDAEGTLAASFVRSASQGACVVTGENHSVVNLAQSPTSQTTDVHFTTRSCPNMVDCTVRVT